uniref:Uncharacterized protein n=1 Tax=Dunaliella tertiolecta TaxID=3047 RepID=A0A7S3QYN4_DUNTE
MSQHLLHQQPPGEQQPNAAASRHTRTLSSAPGQHPDATHNSILSPPAPSAALSVPLPSTVHQHHQLQPSLQPLTNPKSIASNMPWGTTQSPQTSRLQLKLANGILLQPVFQTSSVRPGRRLNLRPKPRPSLPTVAQLPLKAWDQQQQQQQQASQRRAQANPRGRRASQAQSARSRSSSAMGDDFQDGNAVSVDAVLQALGPEARATAQATFGSRLERLSGAEELVEFLEVLQTLQEDMGLEFELYSTKSRSPRAGPRYSSASSTQSRAGSRFGSVSRGAQASKSSSSSSQKRASASSRSSSAARGADAWAQASPQMRRRAAAQALRQRALGAEVYLRSPNRDWVCICADDEGLVLLDADDEDTVVAVPWTEADIDDLEHVAEMYTDAAIMDDEEDELDILVGTFFLLWVQLSCA